RWRGHRRRPPGGGGGARAGRRPLDPSARGPAAAPARVAGARGRSLLGTPRLPRHRAQEGDSGPGSRRLPHHFGRLGRQRRAAGAPRTPRAPHRGSPLDGPLRPSDEAEPVPPRADVHVAGPTPGLRVVPGLGGHGDGVGGRMSGPRSTARGSRPRRSRIIGLLAVLMLAPAALAAQEPDQRRPDVPDSVAVDPYAAPAPFGPGEHIVYNVKVGIFGVGQGHMSLHAMDTVRGNPTYRAVMGIKGSLMG